jgi:hypothetical protein
MPLWAYAVIGLLAGMATKDVVKATKEVVKYFRRRREPTK